MLDDLDTVLGGSMNSRLFQNVREKRGLAYAVFSGLMNLISGWLTRIDIVRHA